MKMMMMMMLVCLLLWSLVSVQMIIMRRIFLPLFFFERGLVCGVCVCVCVNARANGAYGLGSVDADVVRIFFLLITHKRLGAIQQDTNIRVATSMIFCDVTLWTDTRHFSSFPNPGTNKQKTAARKTKRKLSL